MKNVLICTVGTSLIGNLLKANDRKISEFLSKKNTKGLALELSAIEPEDRMGGAEINSITSILNKGLLDKCEHLYLLVSETEDGILIGDVLEAYYGRHQNPHAFVHVQKHIIEGLSDVSPHLFRTDGLRNLVKIIAEIVRRHGSQSILINATGGYKAQISFAGMIGQALEIPVCYLFERFSEVITLPPQPISLDLKFWLENVNLFFDLAQDDGKVNPVEKDERFSSLVDEINENGEKIIGLSPTGQLFHETFQYRFSLQREALLPVDSGLTHEDKVIKYEDKNSSKHVGLKGYLEKLRHIPYVIRIFTHYYNPDLPIKKYFRPSKKGDTSQIEGGFSDGKGTTKFDLVTTAKNEMERNSAIADLFRFA